MTGATVVLARKFSTTSFWDECRSNKVTVIQYIGEICRYLLNAPPSPLDKTHTIRMAHGNGMRPDVWNRFRDRFGIPLIGEWYASTEGTGILTNYNTGPNGAGAIGYRGTLARTVDKGLKIARFDIQTEELIRDKNGRCIEVITVYLQLQAPCIEVIIHITNTILLMSLDDSAPLMNLVSC